MQITVKVTELEKMVKELKNEKIEYVDILLMEADGEIPASINFNGYDGEGGGVDFGDIKHIDVDADYKL